MMEKIGGSKIHLVVGGFGTVASGIEMNPMNPMNLLEMMKTIHHSTLQKILIWKSIKEF